MIGCARPHLWPAVAALFALLLTVSCRDDEADARFRIVDSDPARGRELVRLNGCSACHEIPGIRARSGRLGPSLHGLRTRAYIAGRITNRADPLVHWIRNAPQYDPHTVMPAFRMDLRDARDIAAYLYEADR